MANLKKWVIVALDDAPLDDLGREQNEVLYWSMDGSWTRDISQAVILYNDEKKKWSLPSHGKWLDITRELIPNERP
jgi:hypothetical protein